MTAGTGVLHSEFNHSSEDELHLLQIWILPARNGLEPGYEQTEYPREDKLNRLRLIGSPDGRDGSLTIHQDVDLFASAMEAGVELTQELKSGRRAFVQVVRGDIKVNGQMLAAGDGARIENENAIAIVAITEAELLLFDMR